MEKGKKVTLSFFDMYRTVDVEIMIDKVESDYIEGSTSDGKRYAYYIHTQDVAGVFPNRSGIRYHRWRRPVISIKGA